jgi:hypothetical protein
MRRLTAAILTFTLWASPTLANDIPTGLEALSGRQVFEPQLIVDAQGTLLLWREKNDVGSNLYLSRRDDQGAFGLAIRVNDIDDSVGSYPMDELRASTAQGPAGELAIAWGASNADIRVAISTDHGATFGDSVRLDQDTKQAYRGFPAIAFDSHGALHAVWIDDRLSPRPGAEEPADLFYARLVDGQVTELNLTASQEPSICGCCRTDLIPTGEGVLATFRNTTADGYRDIFTIAVETDGDFSAPERTSAPLWELNGCPMSGPLAVSGGTLFPDGSGGRKILMRGEAAGKDAEPVFADHATRDWNLLYPPRPIASRDDSRDLLLVPGRPTGRVIEQQGRNWRVVSSDIPKWATSGASSDNRLLVVGALNGELQFAVVDLQD